MKYEKENLVSQKINKDTSSYVKFLSIRSFDTKYIINVK